MAIPINHSINACPYVSFMLQQLLHKGMIQGRLSYNLLVSFSVDLKYFSALFRVVTANFVMKFKLVFFTDLSLSIITHKGR